MLTVHSRGETTEDLPITVAGAVRVAGEERFQSGMTLRDAIISAGGLRRTADPTGSTRRDRRTDFPAACVPAPATFAGSGLDRSGGEALP